MSCIVVSPLNRIAEMAVRHRAREIVSLLSAGHSFHRPGVIAPERHLVLRMNDINCGSTGTMTGPQDAHIESIIEFAKAWDRSAPLLIHCWMGVSRSCGGGADCRAGAGPGKRREGTGAALAQGLSAGSAECAHDRAGRPHSGA